ncbi:hypothetical protein [Dyadobacter sp. 22481]|uniref:hypothetical protein n=1 Tax=Dyadobacter sp. 22481 TaxID=3453926 RepID=UPI003F867CCA
MTGLPFLNIDESHPDHVSVTITDIVGFIEHLQSSMHEPRYTDEWREKIDRITGLIKECQMLGLRGMSVPDGASDSTQSDFDIPDFEIDHGYQPDFEDEELRELAGADHPLYGLADYVEKFLSVVKRQAAADFSEMERRRRAHIEASQDITQLVEARRRLESEIAYGELHPAFQRATEDITSKINYLKDQALAPEGQCVAETLDEEDKRAFMDYFTTEGTKLIPFIVKEYSGTTIEKLVPLLFSLREFIVYRFYETRQRGFSRKDFLEAIKKALCSVGSESAFGRSIDAHEDALEAYDEFKKKYKRDPEPREMIPRHYKYIKSIDDAGRKKGEWQIKIREA